MEILKIIELLQSYSEDAVAYKLDVTFANVVSEAVSLLIGQGEKIADLENELRELKEKAQWIPVTERLPDSNNPVLVYCTNTTISGGYITHIGSFNSGKYWFLRAEPGIATFPVREWQVTHWMPLPEPPKEG